MVGGRSRFTGKLMDEWVSVREFSRRVGVALFAVQKAITQGRIKAVRRSATGRIVGVNATVAAEEWRGTAPVQAHGEALRVPTDVAVALGLAGGNRWPRALSCAADLREALLAIPCRLSRELAEESDPRRVCSRLTDAIEDALWRIAERYAATAGNPDVCTAGAREQ